MPGTPRTPRDLVEEALRLLLAKDMAGFASLWAEDGILEFPFASAGYPQRLEGRDAVREYLRDYNDHVIPTAVVSRTVHETADPEVVVVEFEVDGTVVATQRPYRMSYIAVLTARGGEIAHYRDYWSPLAAAEAMGGSVDELTAAFASEEAHA
ncbi:nuclear transport factor 2 family protein [Streptomyces silvisoli]|uniref:Nuclear transport factor 2 family protein n=1 Tax=Streptomyces silvisoli TaxID=3034235 RepID=A0ABT5ZDI7_9ACTN|nr:nuclear transport factor 2 family protein [Streptomyces silvisoli]MDF3287899.1 nuclear transport factor 2 family protein [Streptomyces silvisoli]